MAENQKLSFEVFAKSCPVRRGSECKQKRSDLLLNHCSQQYCISYYAYNLVEADPILKPCPFCAGVALIHLVPASDVYIGLCPDCGAQTQQVSTEQEAIIRWEARAK